MRRDLVSDLDHESAAFLESGRGYRACSSFRIPLERAIAAALIRIERKRFRLLAAQFADQEIAGQGPGSGLARIFRFGCWGHGVAVSVDAEQARARRGMP